MKQGKTLWLIVAVILAAGLFVSGCPKPKAELKKANDALAEARAEGAGEYAPAELAAAEKALAEGKEAERKGRYKQARQKYEEAYRLAQAAKDAAVTAKARDVEPEPAPQPTPVAQPAQPAKPPTKPQPAAPAVSKQKTSHTVAKGECLWWIAEYEDVYNDPFQWPLIYWANQEEIDSTAHRYGHYRHEEDWIYPGQEFVIPRDVSMEKIKAARKKAGAPAPYTPPGM